MAPLGLFNYMENGMGNCFIALMYDGFGGPTPIGLTKNQKLLVLVKKQLIQEATEATKSATAVGDEILRISFQGSLTKLQTTLDAIIPPEIEDLCNDDAPQTH